jgi:N6-L-threonylcarbamoyladenine synthase/protein kinase Bud32
MLDKFAREEGYPFPGGPEIEKFARKGRKLLDMPYSIKGMDMAFSGLMTAARAWRRKGESMEDVSFSLQETAFAMLVEVTERALAHIEKDEVVLGGGVACNERLWDMARVMCETRGAKAFRPEKRLLVDNGAMIAHLGLVMHGAGVRQSISEGAVSQTQRTDDIEVTWRGMERRAPYAGSIEDCYEGAEATVAPTTILGRAAILKRRAPKGYRHPALDASLRKTRTRAEARLLAQARAAGVRTPLVYRVDDDGLILERLPGRQLKEGMRVKDLDALGALVAMLHARGLTHGDLTTSNVLVDEEDLALIDFGLAALNSEDEAKAADLHVLLEALEATHPEMPGAFSHVLTGYRQGAGTEAVERTLGEMVKRGRYRGT